MAGFQTMSGIPKVTSTAHFYSNTNPLLQSRGIGGFTQPSALFGNGEQGAWWDFSDLTVMFQDSAGTVPAALENPVGKVLDKSGKNNHLIQATAGARPILSRRYNRINNTEYQNGGVGWSTNSAPTLNANFGLNPFSRQTALRILATADFSGLFTTYAETVGAGVQKFWIKNNASPANVLLGIGQVPFSNAGGDRLFDFNPSTGALTNVPAAYTSVTAVLSGNGFWEITASYVSNTAGSNTVIVYGRNTADFLFGGIDNRLASDAALALPQYQYVTSASVYDTLGFPAYLLFDGATKWMQSASTIPFSGQQMTAVVGQTYLVGATAMLYESGPSIATTDGTFNLGSAAGFQFLPAYRGTVSLEALNTSVLAAPYNGVLSTAIDGTKGTPLTRELFYSNNVQLPMILNSGGTTAGPFTSQTLYVGSRTGSSQFFNGRMFGLIIRNALTNDNDLQMTNKWMGSKCGLFF